MMMFMKGEPITPVRRIAAALPLGVLPPLALALARSAAPWQRMWLTAIVIFACCKWMTWLMSRGRGFHVRDVLYLLAWPGLNATAFLDRRRVATQAEIGEWVAAVVKVIVGLLLYLAAVRIAPRAAYVAGWIAMCGTVLILHFGVLHLLSGIWRAVGINARPLMNAPTQSTSLADFWGRRWNTAFRDATHAALFQPLTRWLGPVWATIVGFFISGVIHELVITIPAGGGYGLPTLYFLLQAAGMLFERTAPGKRLRGRVMTWIVVILPAPLLFPPAFVLNVMVPFANAIVPPAWTLAGVLTLPRLIFIAGLLQWSVLVASAMVPAELNWKTQFTTLPRLLRQMFWTYGGYVVLAIVFNGLICIAAADEMATTRVGRIVCGYILVFWGVRLALQWVFDAEPFLTRPLLRYGDRLLTAIFSVLTAIFVIATFRLID